MLSYIELEILNAHKFKLFIASDKQRMLFFPLINVKMPTIVGILTFYKCYNANSCWHFNIYEQENFHAQLI